MISKTDIEIYEELFQEKSISEKYLGYVTFDWVFSLIKYHADCTLAIPFDLFDKVIVGILMIDDALSIEQLGEILGLNLIEKPESQQYKDEAEYDILRIALDNLNDYNMIEIGDTSYSSCKLTKQGRTFAEKGHKFKVDENRPFYLFYDHITSHHTQAKKELQHLNGKPIRLVNNDDFLDESLMQSIAEIQVPEIHNPKLGNSFINSRIDYRGSASYNLKIAIALLFDVVTKQTRLIAIEPVSNKTNRYFTSFINLHKQEFIDLFEPVTGQGIMVSSETIYLDGIKEDRTRIEGFINTSPQEAINLNTFSNLERKFIDQEFFWLNLKLFISDISDELFLLITNATDFVITKIRALVEDVNSPFVFIVFKQSESEAINSKIRELFQFSTHENNKLFVAVFGEVSRFDCFISSKNKTYSLEETLLEFENEEGHFSKFYFQKIPIPNADIPEICMKIKRTLADDYLRIIERNISNIIEYELEDEELNKRFILGRYNITKKASAFANSELSEFAREALLRIKQNIENYISELKGRHISLLTEKVAVLSKHFEEISGDKLEEIIKLENNIADLEPEYFEEYHELKVTSDNLKKRVNLEVKRIREEVLSKTYIIDTNVFIKEPDVISKIDLTKHNVALSLSVIEELDKLKTKPENKANADKAIRNINALLQSAKTAKRNRVRKQGADLTLLPVELQKKTSDNMILSLAMVYRKQNPLILTLDRNFQSKAMMLDIPLITLNELLGIKEEVKPKLVKAKITGVDYKVIFTRMKPDKNGDYHIADFISLLRKEDKSFDYKKLGFENVFKFILSLSLFKIYKSKFLKLK
jgi:rRNA-processing protein FCF1